MRHRRSPDRGSSLRPSASGGDDVRYPNAATSTHRRRVLRAGGDPERASAGFQNKHVLTLAVSEAYAEDFKAREGHLRTGGRGPTTCARRPMRRCAGSAVTRTRCGGAWSVLDAGEVARACRDGVFDWAATLIDAGREVAPDPDAVPAAPPDGRRGDRRNTRAARPGDARRRSGRGGPEMMYGAVLPYLGEEAAATSSRSRRRTTCFRNPTDLAGTCAATRFETPRSGRRHDAAAPHKLASVAEGNRGESRRAAATVAPGRHGLPREFVVENQRRRIAAGMIAVVVERATRGPRHPGRRGRGRLAPHLLQLLRRQGRGLLRRLRQVTDFLAEAMREAGLRRVGLASSVRAELDALLGCFEANPDLARFCLEVPPAAGGRSPPPTAIFSSGCSNPPRRAAETRQAAAPGFRVRLVGGLAALIVAAVEESEAEGFPALLPEVTELVLTPYLGREAAVKAAA